ncbi:hypothetical protein QQF64_023353 [Cirrhinus molitorella]|uniref:Uncharacterized protein n=2 Tax=Cirrhinus molitorella TaxID=172907 RepID=A0AA88T8J5_9TELE|nr:hypothetical protein Q8A67_025744 [Cirrhinus molitorella]
MGSAPRKVLPVEEQSLSTDSSSSSSPPPPSSFNNSAVPLIIITAPSRENLLEMPAGLKIADANKEPRPMGGPVFVGRGRFITGTA